MRGFRLAASLPADAPWVVLASWANSGLSPMYSGRPGGGTRAPEGRDAPLRQRGGRVVSGDAHLPLGPGMGAPRCLGGMHRGAWVSILGGIFQVKSLRLSLRNPQTLQVPKRGGPIFRGLR